MRSAICVRGKEAILPLVLLIRRGFAGQEPAPPCAGLCLLIAGTAYQETQYEAAKSDAPDHWPRIFMNVIIRKFGRSARVLWRHIVPNAIGLQPLLAPSRYGSKIARDGHGDRREPGGRDATNVGRGLR